MSLGVSLLDLEIPPGRRVRAGCPPLTCALRLGCRHYGQSRHKFRAAGWRGSGVWSTILLHLPEPCSPDPVYAGGWGHVCSVMSTEGRHLVTTAKEGFSRGFLALGRGQSMSGEWSDSGSQPRTCRNDRVDIVRGSVAYYRAACSRDRWSRLTSGGRTGRIRFIEVPGTSEMPGTWLVPVSSSRSAALQGHAPFADLPSCSKTSMILSRKVGNLF